MLTAQSDFRAFWRDTLAELDETPINLDSQRLGRAPYAGLSASRLAFTSLGQCAAAGLLDPLVGRPPRPVVVHAHGYGGRAAMQWLWRGAA